MTDDLAPPVWSPSARELDDVEMLLLGAYQPLRGFMDDADADSVGRLATLQDGTPWPVPITLTVPQEIGMRAAVAGALDLHDEEGAPVATVKVVQAWPRAGGYGIAGEVAPLRPIERGVFLALRRQAVVSLPNGVLCAGPVLGVPLRGPLLAPDIAALTALARNIGADVRLIPLTGHGAPRGVDAAGLVRCCLDARDEIAAQGVGAEVVPVPLPGHECGDGDALAALVVGAYGATHIPGPSAPGCERAPQPVDLPEVVQDLRTGSWATLEQVPAEFHGSMRAADTHSRLLRALSEGEPLPAGLASPRAERELRRTANVQTGLTVMFTGLSGSGKSTLAKAVSAALAERTERTTTLLDGDVVRRMLSSGLTFSRADRELNIRRIGFVAASISHHGGIALCAPIAPYRGMRAEVREMVEQEGGRFMLVYVSTPLAVCEARDRKGLYAKARQGEIPNFTGISDPYEVPTDADVVIDTSLVPLDRAVDAVLAAIGLEPSRSPVDR